ncbi:MAG: helix-turn-helix domain-containing protein [bacterium]
MKDIMSTKELSQYIGFSKSKIYQLIRQKKIPASKIGRQYKFSKEMIDAWLKEKIITLPRESKAKLPPEKNKKHAGT